MVQKSLAVGVKRLGDLDLKVFQVAANRSYLEKEEANERAVELCSEWENYIGDPDWNPFKTITDMRGKNKVHVQLFFHWILLFYPLPRLLLFLDPIIFLP